MRPTGPPLLFVLLLLLAGCTAPAATVDGPIDTALVLPWGFTECQFAVAFIPIPAARLDGRIPEGFRAVGFAEIGLPPDPRGEANVGTELWTCASASGMNGTIERFTYASVFVAVEPPAELANEENLLNFVKWDVLEADPARRALLVEAGVPAYEGEGAWDSWTVSGDQSRFTGRFEMNGTYALSGAALAPADASLRDFRFTEFSPAANGLVVWNTTIHATSAGAGGGIVEAGGLLAEILGAPTAQAYFLAGSGEFVDSTVTIPPRV